MCNALRIPNDPVLLARRRTRATWLIATAGIAVCAWWGFAPLPVLDAPDVTLSQPVAPNVPDAGVEPMDQSVFSALLWNAPETPNRTEQAADDAAQRDSAIRVQLIGITNDHGRLYAVLYDPESDRLFSVGNGDRILQHTVTSISESAVELSDGRSTRRLTLREGRS